MTWIKTARAFFRIGLQSTISYPLNFLLAQAGPLVLVVSFFFLNRIVQHGPFVTSNYMAFVVVGLLGQSLSAGALQGISQELDAAIQQGRLEILLMEPIAWTTVPIGLGIWPTTVAAGQGLLAFGLGLGLGIRINPLGLLEAIPIAALALMSGTALAVLASSVRILAKRSDPVWVVYNLLVSIAGGVAVPINVLPKALRLVSWLLPTTYVNAGLRKLLLPDAQHVYGPGPLWAAAALAVGIVPLAFVAVFAFNRSINTGRRLGVLAGY